MVESINKKSKRTLKGKQVVTVKTADQIRAVGIVWVLLGLILLLGTHVGLKDRFFYIEMALGLGIFFRLRVARILANIYLWVALMGIVVLPVGGKMDYNIDPWVTAQRLILPALVVIFLLWFLNRSAVKAEFNRKNIRKGEETPS